jgi:hypothetical protein
MTQGTLGAAAVAMKAQSDRGRGGQRFLVVLFDQQIDVQALARTRATRRFSMFASW